MPSPKHEDALYVWVGQQVRERREGKFTQAELASLLGLSRTSVTNLERGQQRIPLHLLLRLAEALDCEMAQLLPARADLALGIDDEELSGVAIVGELTPAARAVLGRYSDSRGNNERP